MAVIATFSFDDGLSTEQIVAEIGDKQLEDYAESK
jgi:hypothetical protein